ncbi:hypothetical protein HID58_087640, partial [Brassica napus]
RMFLWAEFRDPRFYPSSCESLPSIATIGGRSTNRGCKAGYVSGGAEGRRIQITSKRRLSFSTGTTKIFKRLQTVHCVHNAIEFLSDDSPDMDVIRISGEFLLYGIVIRRDIGNKVLKTSVSGLVELNILKNLTVYVVAGSLSRFKSHASNIVFDVFIATCQDPAQNMESSQIDGSNHRTITISTITEDTIIENQGLAASSGLSVLGDKVDEECAAANPPEISDAQNNRKCCRE